MTLRAPSLGAGWLASTQADDTPVAFLDVPVWSERENAPFPTRRTEYRWLANTLCWGDSYLCDAGSGFNPEIHLAADILGNLGHCVVAIDRDTRSLAMPPHPNVTRLVGELTSLPFLDGVLDAYVSISVLEHLGEPERHSALREAYRCLKPGGVVVLTTDDTRPSTVNGWLAAVGFAVGTADDFEMAPQLKPKVAWAVASKP